MILIKEKSGIYPDFSFWLVPLQLLDYLYDAPTLLWLKVKDTKSESNSQLSLFLLLFSYVVAQGQRYKI